VGIALGLVGGWLHHHLPGGGITARYEGIYAVGFGLAAFGLADVTVGNGLIAAFVAGIAMGVAERGIPDAFVEFAENVSAISQVLTFFVFGALIVATGYDGEVWRLVLFIALALLVARPLAIMVSFVRSRLPGPQKAFIAWFGPKGVASMLFALFVLKSDVGASSTIFDIAAFVIVASIVAHGLTDTVGARWIERRMGG
jgi:sodium/hydrogen antiporter